MIRFAKITHDELMSAVRTLAQAVLDSDWRPHAIVGIGRGGLVPAVYLSHATGWPMHAIDYSAADDMLADPAVSRLIAAATQGNRLLFVDDINDSGRTITRLAALMNGAALPDQAIRFATLIDNVGSSARVDYAARTIDRAVTKDWFVFPWEAMAPDHSLREDATERPERIA